MKLLFNITDKEISSNEIKALLGYVNADLSFENLMPDINTSTNIIKKLIGRDVYDLLHEIYIDALEDGVYEYDYTSSKSNIIRATRYAILIKAYSLFAPTNDLSHGNDGRTMMSSDNQKTPFQWMIDKDDKEQEKRYFRALDDLIDLLDDSMPDGYEDMTDEEKAETIYYKWTNSDAYKQCKELFINSVNEFDKVFQIESRLLLIKLTSGLKDCELREILPRIGKEKFDLLKAGTSTDVKDLKLLMLIKEACVFYALAWGIPRMSISLFPEGTLQFMVSDRTTINAKKPAIMNENDYAAQAFKQSFQRAIADIEDLMAPIPDVAALPTGSIYRPTSSDDLGFSAT